MVCAGWLILNGHQAGNKSKGGNSTKISSNVLPKARTYRQDFAWVGASTGSMSAWGGSGRIFPREILKNQDVEVHFSCILRVILTLPLRLSGPLWRERGCGRTYLPVPLCLRPWLRVYLIEILPISLARKRRRIQFRKKNGRGGAND